MATKSPPMNSMLESFRYSILTCNKTAHTSVAVGKVFQRILQTGLTGMATSRDGDSTSSAFMMPIIGKRTTGRRAVTARGMHSVHQYRAMSIIA